jgi:hypothetical protein
VFTVECYEFICRGESAVATDGDVDLLGFSERKTVPVIK